jgi:heterodisulfide reductase subunit A-like polyferredoxin
MRELPVGDRLGGFAEVELGYDDASAQAEAARCLACALCSECLSCVYACGRDAIDHDMVERIEQIQVGAVILAPGYQVYRAELSQEYGLGRYPNVVTALQLERLLSASGPTGGHVQRPSDGQPARKIAFLQCVGSRDRTHDYCSAVCCMYAAKEAVMIREHDPQAEVHVFMMDMRAFSKGYQAYYQRAREQYGIQYTRCRISEVKEEAGTRNLLLRYAPELPPGNGGGPHLAEETFDLVVLSVGMEIADSVRRLGRELGVELDDYGFCSTPLFDPLQTSRPGIYAAGPFRGPKDIPESVLDASGAAGLAAGLLAPARGTLARAPEYPPERSVAGEDPQVGVFVCHCGSNIGGFLDVPGVAEYAASLPGVVHAEHNLYTCSQDSIAHITQQAKELGLNRVVVASCTPRTHAPLFQDSLRGAGLNPALFEMANIRNQCSWVHSHDWEAATHKAKDLVRMAVARAGALQPLATSQVEIEHQALVVGGGAAGMTAALSLAEGGFGVHLVEREPELGGNLRHVYASTDGGDPQEYLRELVRRIETQPRIRLHLGHEVTHTSGFKGRFLTRLRGPEGEEVDVAHGATVLATGAQEYRGPEYGYETSPRVLTGLEFEAMLTRAAALPRADAGDRVAAGPAQRQGLSDLPELDGRALEAWQALGGRPPEEIAMILCVGPAERFCGRICCTTALKNALALKRLNPAARVTVIYRDIRAYGTRENLYTEARRAGVVFLRYDDASRPQVIYQDGRPVIRARDLGLGRDLELRPDLLVLSTPPVPSEGSRRLASQFKVPVDGDGFFLEAHVKLRPVDFATEGLFMAGMAHYPKLLDEAIVQAQAAAARAARLLSQPALTVGGSVAQVDPEKCVGCLTCVRVCPFDVPQVTQARSGVGGVGGAAFIEPTICRGCGSCVSECPAKAIQLAHYQDDQIMVKLDALLLQEAAPA